MLTDLEQLVATCETVIARLNKSPYRPVRQAQFSSPAGISYNLSLVEKYNLGPGGDTVSQKYHWLSSTLTSSACDAPVEDARLLALCDWTCSPTVAVITHSVTSSDFLGEISSSQSGSLLSALHLALTHMGLRIPAVVQVRAPVIQFAYMYIKTRQARFYCATARFLYIFTVPPPIPRYMSHLAGPS